MVEDDVHLGTPSLNVSFFPRSLVLLVRDIPGAVGPSLRKGCQFGFLAGS